MSCLRVVESFELFEGIFLQELRNRFLCEVEIGGKPTICYVPSSCHLSNFLEMRGRRVLLAKNQGNKTRTQYALFALPYKHSYILLSPGVANHAIAANLTSRCFSFLGNRKHFRTELTVDGYKADLYIEDTRTIVEVKGVISLQTEAVFPTVFSERSLKQLNILEQRLNSGYNACLLIVSLNPYVKALRINTEFEFFQSMERCQSKGLMLHACNCRYSPESGIRIDKSIPIAFEK